MHSITDRSLVLRFRARTAKDTHISSSMFWKYGVISAQSLSIHLKSSVIGHFPFQVVSESMDTYMQHGTWREEGGEKILRLSFYALDSVKLCVYAIVSTNVCL